LIGHEESLSIAEYYTVVRDGIVIYRPTVCFAYLPCPDAVASTQQFADPGAPAHRAERLLMNDIKGGVDELGIMIVTSVRGIYWSGFRLSISDARRVPYNNATSLQVAASVLVGLIWAITNQRCGIIEPDQMDAGSMWSVVKPYLGRPISTYANWHPTQRTMPPLRSDREASLASQFGNFLLPEDGVVTR
jgi:homospermidine synthase